MLPTAKAACTSAKLRGIAVDAADDMAGGEDEHDVLEEFDRGGQCQQQHQQRLALAVAEQLRLQPEPQPQSLRQPQP
ncbi:hypothetical protein OJJOAM_003523 [Cupriavidus sp. H18C1]